MQKHIKISQRETLEYNSFLAMRQLCISTTKKSGIVKNSGGVKISWSPSHNKGPAWTIIHSSLSGSCMYIDDQKKFRTCKKFGMWENLVRVPDIVKGQAGLVNLTDVGKFV